VVTLARLLVATLGGLCLVLAGSWLVADTFATQWARAELSERAMADVLSVGRVSLPAPNRLRVHDADLRDPHTGEIVAHADTIDVHFALPIVGGSRGLRVDSIRGRGGRALLSRDGDTLGLVRAIERLIDDIDAFTAPSAPGEGGAEAAHGAAADGGSEHVPPIEFHDITAVLRVPGLPLETMRGCTMHLDYVDEQWRVLIGAGTGGGSVLLLFDDDGLLRVGASGVPVSSAHTLFMPEDGDLLARELRPEGLLDLTVERRGTDDYAAHGVLEQATLHPPRVPFPLERVSLPFEYAGERLHLKDARLGFDGGELRMSVEHDPGGMIIALDVVDARFRADYLELFPQTRGLPWLRAEDGGNIELHLRIEQGEKVRVRGWGGVLVERVWVGETQVEVEDVVGSFDVRDSEIMLRETSGVCAGGLVRVRGRTDAITGEVEFDASVFDVDLAQVRRALAPPESLDGDLTGWVQGELHYEGRIGDPDAGRGAGQLSVRGGNLWNVKVLNAILTSLGRGRPEPSERHRLELRFTVRGDPYRIEALRLASAVLSLLGEGRIRRHNELDIEITPISVPIGPLGDLLEYVERQIVKVEVRGTLEDPRVNVIPIKSVTRPVGSVWSWLTGLFSSGPEPAPQATP
jgi:hypothetical protein